MTSGILPRNNTLILMYVKTRDAEGNPIHFKDAEGHIIESVVRANVFMTDTSGDVDNTEEFTSSVRNTSNANTPATVTWVGAVSNHIQAPRDFVIINGIEVTGGNNFLRNSRGLPSSGGYPSYWQGNIASNAHINDELDYSINFMVWFDIYDSQGHRIHKEVTLDPKLKIDPSTGSQP